MITHDTLRLRVVFVPDGEEERVSHAELVAVIGPGMVKFPAVFVPDGSTPPGYPYAPFGRIKFDRHDKGEVTNQRVARPKNAAQDGSPPNTLPCPGLGDRPAREAATVGGVDSHPGHTTATSEWTVSGDDRANRYLDSSRSAIRAAVRALSAAPTYGDYSWIADWTTPADRPDSSPPPMHVLNAPAAAGAKDPIADQAGQSAHPQLTSEVPPEASERFARTSTQANERARVILPSGLTVPDAYSDTGRLMSPVADLAPVAAAGRRTGQMYRTILSSSEGSGGALPNLAISLLTSIGQGGRFDYQRQGSRRTGFTQFPQYRNVSNFNVGLFCQQAGLSLEETLVAAGRYAHIFSGNAMPNQPYGLDPRTAEFIKSGYAAGQSGVFDPRSGSQ